MRITRQRHEGFTLVELAIALVIIGLLVGGILIGQDLIKAATIRSTITDIEKVNAATTTFRSKYSGLPGDLSSRSAREFGFINSGTAGIVGRTGAAGRGDGNNIIEGCSAGATTLGCETALFWVDLSTAGIIAANLRAYDGTTAMIADQTTSAALSNYMPVQNLRDSSFLHVYPINGKNNLYLGSATASNTGVLTISAGVTPGEARAIDEKFDDAYPTGGSVLSITALGTVDATSTVSSSTCVDGTASPVVYNVVDANINNVNCMLRLRTSF